MWGNILAHNVWLVSACSCIEIDEIFFVQVAFFTTIVLFKTSLDTWVIFLAIIMCTRVDELGYLSCFHHTINCKLLKPPLKDQDCLRVCFSIYDKLFFFHWTTFLHWNEEFLTILKSKFRKRFSVFFGLNVSPRWSKGQNNFFISTLNAKSNLV